MPQLDGAFILLLFGFQPAKGVTNGAFAAYVLTSILAANSGVPGYL
jgi:hypothetical protein